MLVWGAIDIATRLGVSDLIIGLTVVAIGTSLPELASSLIAARKGEHELVLGNVIGSNIFNVLAVVGIATVIAPIDSIEPNILYRDWLLMLLSTIILLFMCMGIRKQGRVNRIEGATLCTIYIAYSVWLVLSI